MAGSGGDPFFFDAIDELHSSYDFGQAFRMMKPDPSFFGTLTESKSHRQYGLFGETAADLIGSQPYGCKS
jgi:hypothetical protein